MSHHSGMIRFDDGQICFYEHDATSGVILSHHYDTLQEVDDNWRKGEWLSCVCGKEEKVSIYSSGDYIPGVACRNCKSVYGLRDKDFDWYLNENGLNWAEELSND